MRTGKLDYRGNLLLQILEQNTLNDIGNSSQFLTTFTCTMSRFREIRQSNQLFSLNLEVLQPQPKEGRQIYLHGQQQLPVKTDNVEEKY